MPAATQHYRQALELSAHGNIGEAILVLEHAVETCNDNADVAKLLAKLHLQIDEVRAFQNWCHEALRINPKDPEPHLMLAAYLEENNRLYEAGEEREAAARLLQK